MPFSELLRQPAKTTDRLAHTRALRMRRRDASDLALMLADRADAEAEIIDVAARLLAAVATRDPELLRKLLPTALPWVRFLPPGEVTQLAREFIETATAAASVGSPAAVGQLLTEWRHTAEVFADPDLHQALTSALGDFGPVRRLEGQ